MATVNNVVYRIKQSRLSILSIHATLAREWREQRPVILKGGLARPWGAGYNEDFNTWSKMAFEIFFGCQGDWPDDSVPAHTRVDMARVGSTLADLDNYLWLEAEGQLERFKAVLASRGPSSLYKPPTAEEFIESITEGVLLDSRDARDFPVSLKREKKCSWRKAVAIKKFSHWLEKHKEELKRYSSAGVSNIHEAKRLQEREVRQVSYLAITNGIPLTRKVIAEKLSHLPYEAYPASKVILDVIMPDTGVDLYGPVARFLAAKIGSGKLTLPEFRRRRDRLQLQGWSKSFAEALAAGIPPKEILYLDGWVDLPKSRVNKILALAHASKAEPEQSRELLLQVEAEEFGFTTSELIEISRVFNEIRGGYRVLRWLLSKWRTPALKKERTAYLPGGMVRKFTALDILDEILPEDLGEGGSDASVDLVIRRSHNRLQALYEKSVKDEPLPKGPKGDENVHQLMCVLALIDEGRRMHHCVGGYIEACRIGTTFVYHVGAPAPRGATAELSMRNGRMEIIQVRARLNAEPTKEDMASLKAWFSKISPDRLD